MSTSQRHFLLFSALCALLASLLFLPGLKGDFVFDDKSNIVDNQAIHLQDLTADALFDVAFGVQPGGITRVLPTVTYALDYWRGGGADPAVFKTTNIAIHALTTLVLAWLLRALLLATGVAPKRAAMAALALAFAWAAHPLQVSSVLYVVQRMQTMSTLFLLLALWAYLQARQRQIEGRPGRTGWLLAVMAWILAFGCKEDAALLPAYTLALEVTVLRFRADDPALARAIRKGYLLAAAAGTVLFLFAVVPHYWSSGSYYGRDFSSYERLLTQARVLCMYLWQAVLPLPQHMPFYYDWLQPSRGLLQPWTTLPALALLAALLALAWRLRWKRPLFALGVLLFFASHFITSNVIGLELAFEHRNHFGLIGALLALGDVLVLAALRLRIPPIPAVAACTLLLALSAGATVARSHVWDSRLGLAQASTELAPGSARAWNSLCVTYNELAGKKPGPYLDKAIDACSRGADAASFSLSSLINFIVYKTKRGDIDQADWNRLHERLQHVSMGPENSQAIWVIMNNARSGVPLDENGVLKAIDILTKRMHLQSGEYAAIGYFVLGQTHQPEQAYPYLARSVEMAPPNDPLSLEIIAELRKEGRMEWVEKLEEVQRKKDINPMQARSTR